MLPQNSPCPCGFDQRLIRCARRSRTNRHQLAGRRRQTASRRLAMHMRAIGVGDDQPGSPEKSRTEVSWVQAKNSRSQCARVVLPLWSARKSSIDD